MATGAAGAGDSEGKDSGGQRSPRSGLGVPTEEDDSTMAVEEDAGDGL